MQVEGGSTFAWWGAGEPTLAWQEAWESTSGLLEAIVATLSIWEARRLGWGNKVIAYTILSRNDGLHVNWSLGRLIHFSLYYGVEGPTLSTLGIGGPTLTLSKVVLLTLSLAEACISMLDSRKIWQIGWSGVARIDPTLR